MRAKNRSRTRYVVGVLLGTVVVGAIVYGGPGLLMRLGIWMFRDKRIVYHVPGMDRVHEQKNMIYKDVAGQTLMLDLYTPAEPSEGAGYPVVLLIHGGPVPPQTAVKDWGAFVSYGQLLAASGIAAVAFNHRFYSAAAIGEAAEDVRDALGYVRDHAPQLHLDPERICLWAFSGGGPQLSVAIREAPPFLRCLVAFYAFLDVEDVQLKQYSPLAQLRARTTPPAPMFIARMGQDLPQLNVSVAAFVQEAEQKHFAVAVSDYPAGRHAFDIRDDTEESRQVIAKAVVFVQTHLHTRSEAAR